MSKRSRLGALLLAVTLTLTTTACIGPFPATNAVYDWNHEVSDNEWAQEGVFMLFNILPVYGITLFVDAIVLNSIEFWTGEPAVEALEESADAVVPIEEQSLVGECEGKTEECSKR